MEKCKDIQRRMTEETESVGYSGGQDGLLTVIHKKYAQELASIQKEYSHLFT